MIGATMRNLLTHQNMRRHGETWRCLECGRTGTIAEINAVPCPVVLTKEQSEETILAALDPAGDHNA